MLLCSWRSWCGTHTVQPALRVSREESGVCFDTQTGPAPSLSHHPVAPILQTEVHVHSAHVQGQQPWEPLPILSVKRLMVPKDLVSIKYKLNPYRGLWTQKVERYNIYGPIKAVTSGWLRENDSKNAHRSRLLCSSGPGPASDTFTKHIKLQTKA